MSLHGDYDAQNIFAQIIRGEAPCYKLYEDEDVLAFLDVFPQSYGHTLVIPKRSAARNILEVDLDSLAKVMAVVQQLTGVLVAELQEQMRATKSKQIKKKLSKRLKITQGLAKHLALLGPCNRLVQLAIKPETAPDIEVGKGVILIRLQRAVREVARCLHL